MSLGRRKVGIDQPSRWVFNRMAAVYDARPMYPAALVDAIAALTEPTIQPAPPTFTGRRIVDIGAGIGHLALPLAERGFDVAAVEPALEMLQRLRDTASARGLSLRALHGSAETLPLESASQDLAIVADALHFMDAQLTAQEIARVLVRRGTLALVTCQFGDTPFMRAVLGVVEDAVPRRPRDLTQPLVHISSITGVQFDRVARFHDETPVDHPTLERILRSVSFIGPAMNPARFAEFRDRVYALSPTPVWARTFVVRSGRRSTAAYRDAVRAAASRI
jgi:ubiquinone/menaquinone biosynthesis C-methylase UbiE